MPKADWDFPCSNGGVASGFNDAGIENFMGDKFRSLGREIIQNSTDAGIENSRKPVIVNFKTFSVPRNLFPGIDSLQKSMKSCLKIAKDDDDRKAESFFQRAVKELKNDRLEFLRIDDFNTTGLWFDHKKPKKNPFYAITKGRGTSRKQSDTAAGSYGIGQNAPFAVSRFRTVFYATHYLLESGKPEDAFQGKSILTSHLQDRKETQGTGFYGNIEGLKPLFNTDVPELFRRSSYFDKKERQGTSVFVAGFDSQPNWDFKLAASIIINFFMAIDERKLIVSIDDEFNIKSENLQLLFEDSRLLGSLKGELRNEFSEAQSYYWTYKTAEVKESQLRNLGHCKLWIGTEDDEDGHLFTRQAALMRKNGMLITDSQKGLQKFRGVKDFTAVFKCESLDGNRMLREMEPPRHDCFEPERAQESKKARICIEELKKFIKEEIRKRAAPEEGEISQLSELEEFLPNPDPEDAIPGSKNDGEVNPEGRQIITLKPVKRASPALNSSNTQNDGGKSEGNEGGASGQTKSKGGTQVGKGTGEEGRTGGRGARLIGLSNVRVIGSLSDLNTKTILFTPENSGMINLRLQIAGDTDFEDLSISGVEEGYELSDGKIRNLEVNEGTRVSFKVHLSTPYNGSMKVVADEVRP